jgi:hypothetical protein
MKQRDFHNRRKRAMRTKTLRLILLVSLLPALSGCWYVAAAGAGAGIGYYASEKGYKPQSPVTYSTPKGPEHEEKH